MKPPSWGAPAFFALALAVALIRAPQPSAAAFVPPPAPAPSSLRAEFQAELLPRAAASAHATTLAQLPDGRLAAAWFAGSREGAADVAIWFALRDASGWQPPHPVATRQSTAAARGAHVRKLGNPVLLAAGGQLHLWYVSAAVGGWAGSSINHSVSADAGATWSAAARLVASPFLNISTLVRTPPLPLAGGEIGLPVYHEFADKRGEWLRLGRDGRIIARARLDSGGSALQPAVAALDASHALALLRNSDGSSSPMIRRAATADGGESWRAEPDIAVGNPNSSVALLRLPSGRLLLAANPPAGRNALQLWLGDPQGRTWSPSRVVEADGAPDAEFSYPALLLDGDGRIHLAYTWKRQAIKHAQFSEAWLEGRQ